VDHTRGDVEILGQRQYSHAVTIWHHSSTYFNRLLQPQTDTLYIVDAISAVHVIASNTSTDLFKKLVLQKWWNVYIWS